MSNEEWGMLGKNDFDNKVEDPFEPILGKIMGGAMNNLFSGMIKNIEKEMTNSQPKPRLRLVINGKEIPMNNSGKVQEKKQKKINSNILLPVNTLKNLSKLSRKDPKTNLRRIGDSLLYEIELPGVNSEKDISIRHLGNSIEVQAVSSNNAYFKSIAIALPIVAYALENEILTLELGQKEG